AWPAHQAAGDPLAAMITALGAQPVEAATAYRLPFPVRNGAAAVMLAAFLEDRVAAAYLGLVALGDARLRAFGARAVRSAALRAVGWRGRSLAFPGLELPAPRQAASAPGRASPSPPPGGAAGGRHPRAPRPPRPRTAARRAAAGAAPRSSAYLSGSGSGPGSGSACSTASRETARVSAT